MIRNTYFGLALFSLLSLGIESKTLSARGRYLRHDNPPVEDNTKSKASLNDFVANQMNLKFFEAALVTTGWARELEGQKHHTFFAPCDDTFNDAAQKGLKDKLKKPMYRTHLHSFVAAQLFEGKLSPSDMTPEPSDTEIEMMDNKCKTTCAKSSTSGAIRINGYNRVLKSSECSNGYAYVTQRFVEPPFWFRSLWDVVQFDLDEEASLFAGLVVQEGMQSILMNEEADYTLFIPNNDALAPMIESGNPAPYSSWEDLIRNHIVANHVQATKYMEPNTRTGLVTLSGTEVDMEFRSNRRQYTVTCADRFTDFTATITTKDQLACNGVAHVINSILKPVE